MVRYKLYLDGILINERPKGLDELILAIQREDGFNNSEQILRESIDVQLEFSGDGYRYICTKRQQNFCEEILCSLDAECDGYTDTLFEGLIKQNDIKVTLKKCIAKTSSIKDNSFSGLIRDWINIPIYLYNTKTKNCQPLSIDTLLINTPPHSISGVYYPITDIKVFDVLDVFKYIVSFFTDNRITVKSTYLTNNKYAITTGFNMHNEHGNLDKVYPEMSLETLFNELRKKLVIYMGIEYESDGTPYLRIEDEGYFYTNDELFVIDELPDDAEEEIDENSLYNQIAVGSNTVEIQQESTIIKSQDRLDAWNEETYLGCGGCSGQKDSNLDLVSNFIIDANIIHEAMLQTIPTTPDESDYANDDAIFLLNYYISGLESRFYFPSGYTSVGFINDGYNKQLNNRSTLERWVGVSNSCISVGRFAKYGFQAINGPDVNVGETSTIDYMAVVIATHCPKNTPYTYHLGCYVEVFDNLNSHTVLNDFGNSCSSGGYLKSLFTCQEIGIYKFRAKSDIKAFVASNVTDDFANGDFEIRFVVYQDSSLTTIIDSSAINSVHMPNNTTTVNFDIESPPFNLMPGNIVMVEVSLTEIIYAYGGRSYIFHFFNSVFELLEDNTTCDNIIDQTGNFKPFLTNFQYPISLETYKKIKAKKGGYILIQGQEAWIKKIEYRPDKLSTLILKHKRTLSECTN